MTSETGTPKELNLQPGDVVECLMWFGDMFVADKEYTVSCDGRLRGEHKDDWVEQDFNGGKFRIVSRAADTPKLWRDMTPGTQVQVFEDGDGWQDGFTFLAYHSVDPGPFREWVVAAFKGDIPKPYKPEEVRIRPDPKRETVTIEFDEDGNIDTKGGCDLRNVRITFDLIDRKPGPGSAKIEPIGGRE
jgi:hypothetical protein